MPSARQAISRAWPSRITGTAATLARNGRPPPPISLLRHPVVDEGAVPQVLEPLEVLARGVVDAPVRTEVVQVPAGVEAGHQRLAVAALLPRLEAGGLEEHRG